MTHSNGINSGKDFVDALVPPCLKRSIPRGWSIVALTLFSICLRTGSAQTETASNQNRQAALANLTAKLHVGTEFFLNRTATKESVDKHFRLMHDNGLDLVRIFIIWDDVERTRDVWDFERYDWIYDAAAKNGIKIAATLCAEDPPGWMDKTSFYHSRVNLDNPVMRANGAIYLEKVVGHFKNHPAQGAWLIMNEPTKYDADEDTFKVYGAWLQKKYGTVSELNKHRFRTIENFADVKVTKEDTDHGGWIDEEALVDWKNFNVDNLIDELTWVRDQVLAIDPNHPTHFNVTQPVGDGQGQDVWKEKKIPDILGVTMHAAWAFPGTTPESDFGELYANRLDLIANASNSAPIKPFWVTELQSGPTFYTGGFALTVTPQDLSRWMWDSYGAGANAVIFWLWQPRDIGREGGEWGLVSLDGVPSVRLPAVKAIADTLKRNPELAQARPQPAKVAILYDRDAEIVNKIDGLSWQDANRPYEVTEAFSGCYRALLRAHIPTQFVDLDQLKKGEVDGFDVLYAPDAYAMDDEGIEALKKYVKQGGTLWADGLTGWKTPSTSIRPTIPGGLTDLFGVEATDMYPVQPSAPYSVTAQNELGGELVKLPLNLKGAEVVMRDHDGNIFEVKHYYGKGQVFYFSSVVSLAYARRNNPIVQQWIVSPALGTTNQMPVQMKEGSDRVIFRGMVGPSGPIAVLSNWGDTQQVAVSFKGTHKVTNAMTGAPLKVTMDHGNSLATLLLDAGSSVLFKTD